MYGYFIYGLIVLALPALVIGAASEIAGAIVYFGGAAAFAYYMRHKFGS